MTPTIPIADAEALRSAYTQGEITPVDVVDEVLARIDDQGDDHVWITRVEADELHLQAKALAARLDEIDSLPLYGVPFAVKDNIDAVGLPTTAGCPAFTYTPDRSTPAVDLLIEAGAILVGKTNLDQLATGLTGTRSPYGMPRHPAGPDRVPGGSSSGSAVAVASGLVTFALGTDTAGSGRVPAALCGIVGLKPAPGWCSNEGVVPACASFDCLSVFAARVQDAAAAVAVMRGSAPTVPAAMGGWHVAVPDDASLDFSGDDDAERQFARQRTELAGYADLEAIDLADFFAAGNLLYEGPLLAERYEAVGSFVEEHPDDVLPITRGIILGGGGYTAEEIADARQRLAELRQRTGAVWERCDALMVPTVPTVFSRAEIDAEPLARNAILGRYCHFVNLLGLAAVAVPMGARDDGLPSGVMFVGPAEHEDRLVALAMLATS